MDKKAKAEAKRARRTQRKLGGDESESLETQDVDFEGSDVDAAASDAAKSDAETRDGETTDGAPRTPSADPNAPIAPDKTN